jgi:hypothetical protein
LDKQVREAVEGIQKTGMSGPQTQLNYDRLRSQQQEAQLRQPQMQRPQPPVQQQQQVPPWMMPQQQPQAPPQQVPWQNQPRPAQPPLNLPGLSAGESLEKKKKRLLGILWVIFFLTLACTVAVAVYFFVMAK